MSKQQPGKLASALIDQDAKIEILRLALATWIRRQSPGTKDAFLEAFMTNVENWEELAITTENPDMWIESLRSHADGFQQLIEK